MFVCSWHVGFALFALRPTDGSLKCDFGVSLKFSASTRNLAESPVIFTPQSEEEQGVLYGIKHKFRVNYHFYYSDILFKYIYIEITEENYHMYIVLFRRQ